MAVPFSFAWGAHHSNRLDPKYHLFKRNEQAYTPNGWIREKLGKVMKRRLEEIDPSETPNHMFTVMTLAQTGEIRPREAGKGKNPPEWLGMYFENGSSKWFQAKAGDVVYSSIDLWKGCISVVPKDFDNAIVTKEFPIYQIMDGRIDAEFLSFLLRCRYYQRAFRAITTGHSNRRRTQQGDFENLEICFPPDRAQQQDLINEMKNARLKMRKALASTKQAMKDFSNVVDGRYEDIFEYEID